ncbi:hypothetical protein RU97_GL001738 [Enterococcus canis]|uniref:Cobalt transport protein n=1 Tax=Enterococcus canis TaxID=214095 RepID=A0A1L8REY1_9ENTE|nr:energy-coupling factor transporter transmembrane component T [Enterococcus canis]OJG18341.1 hypothetical protein RU97_GL001738 [Enterococcus canis]
MATSSKMKRFVRKLNPLTKLLIVLSLVASCVLYPSVLICYALLFVLVVLSLLLTLFQPVMKLVVGFGVPATLMLLFIQGLYSPKNKTFIADLGFAQLGLEGTLYALKVSGTVLVCLVSFYLFLQMTKNSETVAALILIGVSPKIGYLVLASLNVVPQMQQKIKTIREAQESRGVETTGSILTRMKAFLPLLGPIVLSSLTDAQERGMTLETRGFGINNSKPTSYLSIQTTFYDYCLISISFIFLFIGCIIRILN